MIDRDELRQRIAAVWAKALGAPVQDFDKSFFDLGGSSLKMMRIHAELQQELRITIPIVALFAHPTIASLVQHLQSVAVGAGEVPAAGEQADAAAEGSSSHVLRGIFRPYR